MRKLVASSLQLVARKIRQAFLLPATGSRLQAQKGFTLLLAALVASIVLALGAAIFSIAQKQLTLSAIGRDSQFAFYAADTAAECALYWDFRFGYFATTTPDGFDVQTLKCDGQCLNEDVSGQCVEMDGRSGAYPYQMTSGEMGFFQETSSQEGGYCAEVYVTKSIDSSTGAIKTLVHANGYSVNCASISVSPRALQRSVELHY